MSKIVSDVMFFKNIIRGIDFEGIEEFMKFKEENGLRTCTLCLRTKKLSDFRYRIHKSKTTSWFSEGPLSRCMDCERSRRDRYVHKNRKTNSFGVGKNN